MIAAGRDRSPAEIGRIAALTVVAVIALALVFPTASYAWHPPGVFGMRFDAGTGRIDRVEPGGAAARAGLRPGDVILASSLRPGALVALRDPVPGTRIELVARGPAGSPHAATLVARTGTIQPVTARILIAAEEAAFVAFLAVGWALAVMRPGAMTLWLFSYCLGVAPLDAVLPFYAAQPPLVALATTIAARGLLGGWSVAPLVPFLMLFPAGRAIGWRRRAYPVAAAIALAGLVPTFASAVRESTSFDPWFGAADDAIGIAWYLIAAAILAAGVRELAGADRVRVRYAALGMGFAFLAQIFDYVPDIDPHVVPAFNTLAVVMPLSIAYAVVRHHVIDVRFFVDRAAIFATITLGLVVTIGLLNFGFARLLGDFHLATYFTAAASVAIGAGFGRIEHACAGAIERTLFRRRHAADQMLASLGRRFRTEADEDRIAAELANVPCDALGLASAAIYRLGDDAGDARPFLRVGACGPTRGRAPELGADDAVVVELAHALEPRVLRTGELAVPMLAGLELAGFAIYGAHRSGAQLDPAETRRLASLVFAASAAFAHADARRRRIEIEALQLRLAWLEAARP